MHRAILVKNLKERDDFGDLGFYWWIILKCLLEKRVEDVDWIELAEDVVHWQTIFIQQSDLGSKKGGNFFIC
jgi:hypothetical protein